jgi:hypothetical protein
MYGSLVWAFVGALRAFPDGVDYGLNVIQVNDSDGGAVVNTGLPCCTVSLVNADSPVTFMGGGVYERLRVYVQVIVDFINHSQSDDGGVAVRFQNLPYEIRRYVECEVGDRESVFFKDLRADYGFSAVYEGLKTYMSVAYEKAMGKQVLVYSMTWAVNVLDGGGVDDRSVELEGVEDVVLEGVEMEG